jgi:hypothetical protein
VRLSQLEGDVDVDQLLEMDAASHPAHTSVQGIATFADAKGSALRELIRQTQFAPLVRHVGLVLSNLCRLRDSLRVCSVQSLALAEVLRVPTRAQSSHMSAPKETK